MVIHDLKHAVNTYGDSALIRQHIAEPLTTPGNFYDDPLQYDYWDHIDYIINLACKKGIYMALVPVWGSNVKDGLVTQQEAFQYATWLAERYQDKTNVIWVNGGDIRGSDSTTIWQIIGNAIMQKSPDQLITFHPFGRTQSSTWFHKEDWLDFNMFQSGHRRYDQDTSGLCYGEDNWRYVHVDYAKTPVKPTLDAEPSYEAIPHGLHDVSQPRWTDSDVRRYAYWSVFAGACGITYGHNAIMQFHHINDKDSAYGVRENWESALDAPGALQMQYLKKLILSASYFDRIPRQELISGRQGEKYNYIAATGGKNYAFIYTCNGRNIDVDLRKMKPSQIHASWFNPRNGASTEIGIFSKTGIETFDPPGEQGIGNDWVLVLD
jgi:hypothetical protein